MNQNNSDLRLREKIARREKRRSAYRKIIGAKMSFALCVCFLALASLLGRVGYIISAKGAEYAQITLDNSELAGMAKDAPKSRGVIVDRNKEKLAVSASVFRVILDVRLLTGEDEKTKAGETSKAEKTFARLAAHMGADIDELRGIIKKNPDGTLINDTHWYDLGLIDYTTAAKIDADRDVFCVFLIEELERKYPHKGLGSQVIGFMRGDNLWGVEKTYNAFLQGAAALSESGAFGAAGETKSGVTVVTTLDYRIQQFAQTACDKMLADYSAQNTAVIIMNPQTGEILAMAQSPTFDANDPANIQSIGDYLLKINWETYDAQQRSDALNHIWNNYNLTSTFEPGSIYKPIVIAAALEENIITPESPVSYFCSGSRSYEGWPVPLKCHFIYGHGQQTLNQVLSNSCNVAMMQIGELLGRDLFYKYCREFGFGEKTGIDLPAEISVSGLIYSAAQLGPVELATSSFGQGGVSCTPIQAINSFAAVINGGNLMQPYVVSQVLDVYDNVIYENEPTIARKVISKETSDYLREALVSVVSEGTGKKAAIEGYNIGGKTGTGQQGERDKAEYTVSFIAYLPAEAPQILAMTLINKPLEEIEGSTSAAPALKEEVLLKLIEYLNIPPNNPNASPEAKNAESDVLADYIGLGVSDAAALLNTAGIPFEIIGDGDTVTLQSPLAGSDISAFNTVFLTVEQINGTPLIVVPDVCGLAFSEANYAVVMSGFEPVTDDPKDFFALNGANAEAPGEGSPEGAAEADAVITRQSPKGGLRLPAGAQIKLFTD